MADTTTPTVETKSKIVMKTLGNPKVGAALEVGQRFFLGRVVGMVSGVVRKLGDDGETLEGLKGSFKAYSGDGKRVTLSGVCYLPGGINEGVIAAGEQSNGEVQFAYDIFTQPATNKAGYEYVALPLTDLSVADPLAALEASFSTKALPAPPAPIDPATVAQAVADAAKAKEAETAAAAKK